jgi:hypothetical protein
MYISVQLRRLIMATIQKLVRKKGVSYRVIIRKKGVKPISKVFKSKKLAVQC